MMETNHPIVAHKNIIYITGNDSYGVELEVKRWLKAFEGKFGDINIDRYDLSEGVSLQGIGDMILMSGLFTEKRLFIFRGGRDRKSKSPGIEEILTEKLTSIPDDHFLLFHNIGEKEEALISWLTKNADVRNINTLWDGESWEKRIGVSQKIIQTVLSIYKEAEQSREKGDTPILLGHAIAHTLEILFLSENQGKKLSKMEIQALCYGYSGDTVFALVDAIMGLQVSKSIDICHRIASTIRSDEWIGSFIGILRNNLYIQFLKYHKVSENEIAQALTIHPYVLKKGYHAKIDWLSLKKLYTKVVETNIAYKRGKGLKESELGKILAIELALLDLQK